MPPSRMDEALDLWTEICAYPPPSCFGVGAKVLEQAERFLARSRELQPRHEPSDSLRPKRGGDDLPDDVQRAG